MTLAPLSFQQAETLRNMRRSPQSEQTYDYLLLFRLRGAVDRSALAAAVADTVARQPVLRTTVARMPSDPVQQVHPVDAWEPVVPHRDHETVDALSASLLEARLGSAEVLAGHRLFRVRTHQVGSDSYLSFAVHHLVFDGWSVRLLLRDLSACYAARSEQREAALPALGMTYADFAVEQRNWWDRNRDEVLEFWAKYLDGCERLRWPPPRDPGRAGRDDGEVVTVPLDDGAHTGLRALVGRARVTPFTALLMATGVTLVRTCGTADVFLGSDTANREDPRKQHTIGYFTNSRFARLRPRDGDTAGSLLEDLRGHIRRVDAYQDAYSGKILDELALPQPEKVNLTRMSDPGDEGLALPGVEATRVQVRTLARYWRDFTLQWQQRDARLTAAIWYRYASVDADAVAGLVPGTRAVLTADPDAPLTGLPGWPDR